MINHARTLLLNLPGPHLPSPTLPGDVYIPAFSPLDLASDLQAVRAVLFGQDPDYEGMLQRAAQYMAVLHSTEHVAHALALDSRVTYDPFDSGVGAWPYGASVEWREGADAAEVVSATAEAEPFVGRARLRWLVTATGAAAVQVTSGQYAPARDVSVTFNGGLSSDIPLPLSSAALRITTGTGSLIPGQTWSVSLLRRVSPDVAGVLTALAATSLSSLFVRAELEPVKTFRNMVYASDQQVLRLSGVLLALIYRMEDLRSGR